MLSPEKLKKVEEIGIELEAFNKIIKAVGESELTRGESELQRGIIENINKMKLILEKILKEEREAKNK